MFRRYQNEWMVAAALLLLIIAIFFKSHQYQVLKNKDRESTQIVGKIKDIATMKKLWGTTKGIPAQLNSLKQTLAKHQIKQFDIKKHKAHLILESLVGEELNKIVGNQLASIPLQIEALTIERNGEHYKLEVQCKW